MENKEKVRNMMKNQGKVMQNDEKVRKIVKKQRKILENEEKVRKNEGKPNEKRRKSNGKQGKSEETVPTTKKKTKQEKHNPQKNPHPNQMRGWMHLAGFKSTQDDGSDRTVWACRPICGSRQVKWQSHDCHCSFYMFFTCFHRSTLWQCSWKKGDNWYEIRPSMS